MTVCVGVSVFVGGCW